MSLLNNDQLKIQPISRMTKANSSSKFLHHQPGMTELSWTALSPHRHLLLLRSLPGVLTLPRHAPVPSWTPCLHALPAQLVLIGRFDPTLARLVFFQAVCQHTIATSWKHDEQGGILATRSRLPTRKLMSPTLKPKPRKLRLCVGSTHTLAVSSSWTRQARDLRE